MSEDRREELVRKLAELAKTVDLGALELAVAVLGDPAPVVACLEDARKRRCPKCGRAMGTENTKLRATPTKRKVRLKCHACNWVVNVLMDPVVKKDLPRRMSASTPRPSRRKVKP